jgi:hypothetical protein
MNSLQNEVNQLVAMLDNDNLTDYQKEQGRLGDTSQARILHSFISGLVYQERSIRLHIQDQVSKLADHLESSYAGSDTHEKGTQDRLSYIDVNETTLDEIETLVEALKSSYKEATGSVFEPYKKRDIDESKKQTASRMDALTVIDRYKK